MEFPEKNMKEVFNLLESSDISVVESAVTLVKDQLGSASSGTDSNNFLIALVDYYILVDHHSQQQRSQKWQIIVVHSINVDEFVLEFSLWIISISNKFALVIY